MIDTGKTLILGYGNPDRGDDGLAWHVLNELCACFDRGQDALFNGEIFELNEQTDCWFGFQLTPELSDLITSYARLIFIDAHVNPQSQDVEIKSLNPEFNLSPLTHHLTPAGLLGIVNTIGKIAPPSTLIALRGFVFGFSRTLSSQAEITRQKATEAIRMMIE